MTSGVARIMSQMGKAYTTRMANGRAKGFISSLIAYLLEDTEMPKKDDGSVIQPLKLYYEQEVLVTETSDLIKGTVRYLPREAYLNDVEILNKSPPTVQASKRKRSVSPTPSSSSAGLVHSDRGSMDDQFSGVAYHNLTPDCVLSLVDSPYITCVFECSSATDDEKQGMAYIQVVREILSLMRAQNSILGCVWHPNGCQFRLAVKGPNSTLKIYESVNFIFIQSGTPEFNTTVFLDVTRFLLEVIYINVRRLKKQGWLY